jgi:hypothetical protein
LPPDQRQELQKLLTFDDLPDADQIEDRASDIAVLARLAFKRDPTLDAVMIGGAPFLMPVLQEEFLLERELADEHASDPPFRPRVLYAFSRREAVDEPQADGSVRKTQIFRHIGFVEI